MARNRSGRHSANKVTKDGDDTNDSESLVVEHEVLSAGFASNCIVDSGSTCHMCNSRSLFVKNRSLGVTEKVTLEDGRSLDAVGRGTVELVMKLPGGKRQRCSLQGVLFVPDLSYSLLSVSKASEAGKVTRFGKSGCQILNTSNKLIACATMCGSLYMLEFERCNYAHAALTKEDAWHRRYGHLRARGLRQLSVEGLVEGFDYDGTKVIFCEPFTQGKHHRSPCLSQGRERARGPTGADS